MTLEVYGHVFDEFDPAERIPADVQIRRAREETQDVSALCPPEAPPNPEEHETPANPHSPYDFPRISFRWRTRLGSDPRRASGRSPSTQRRAALLDCGEPWRCGQTATTGSGWPRHSSQHGKARNQNPEP